MYFERFPVASMVVASAATETIPIVKMVTDTITSIRVNPCWRFRLVDSDIAYSGNGNRSRHSRKRNAEIGIPRACCNSAVWIELKRGVGGDRCFRGSGPRNRSAHVRVRGGAS